MTRKVFKQLSNAVTAAADTGNVAELHQLDALVATSLGRGDINLPEAGELTADIETALDSLGRNDYLDEGFAAIAQGL